MFAIDHIFHIIPEIILFVGVLSALMIGAFNERRTLFIYGCVITFLALISAIYLAKISDGHSELLFSNFIQINPFVIIIRVVILFIALLVLMILGRSSVSENIDYFEFPTLFMTCLLGILVMCLAHDFLIVYIGLELQSLSLYVLIAAKKESPDAAEASLKYFILGAVASGFLLFGIALIYGFCGGTDYSIVERVISNQVFGADTIGVVLGLIFIITGFAFKLGLSPFHMWLPDVYGGSNYGTILLLGVLPKLAAFYALTQILAYPMYGLLSHWKLVLFVLSLTSLIWSAFAGLVQKNLKRLLAYSSIGNIGFLCLGLSSATLNGVSASFYYLLLYSLTLVIFFGIIIMSRVKTLGHLQDLSGFGKTYPLFSFFLTALIFSFAGIPPLPGFFAKLAILNVLVREGYYIVAVIAVVLSVISVAYYLGIIRAIYMDADSDEITILNFKKSKLLIAIMLLLSMALSCILVKPKLVRETLDVITPSLFGDK